VSVLVTGGQGFIGSWLSRRLAEQGRRVLVPKRGGGGDSNFRISRLDESCEQVRLDLLDIGDVLRVLGEYEVQLVFHLAAQTIVSTANSDPAVTFEVNARGTYNLLEACRIARGEGGVAVVVASSYHAYGPGGDAGYSEGDALRPGYPYDVSKACADLIARSYGVTYDMPVAVTRLANVYGGGDLNLSRLVPATALALARNDVPVIRSDGSPERDYLYVEDAVNAYLAVAASLQEPRFYGRAWNAGSGRAISVLEVVQQVIAASGRDVEPTVEGLRGPRDEIDRQYLDSSAAREELGWAPEWTLSAGLSESYAWYERYVSA
jgi:CDP-glucose 4,6-dehydratase